MYYQEGDAGSFTPIVRNIFLHNVTSGKSPYPLYIRDYSRSPVTNLQLKDCIFSNVSGNSILGNVSGLVMSNVRVNGTLVGTMFESPAARAELLSLQQNYPNPFNPATTIRFTVKQRSAVSITVYDVLGTAIARLPAGSMSVGDHSFSWNGMNSAGVLVPAGVYVYTVQAGNITISKKMIFAK
jgi:hypothetical protein